MMWICSPFALNLSCTFKENKRNKSHKIKKDHREEKKIVTRYFFNKNTSCWVCYICIKIYIKIYVTFSDGLHGNVESKNKVIIVFCDILLLHSLLLASLVFLLFCLLLLKSCNILQDKGEWMYSSLLLKFGVPFLCGFI